MISGSRSSVPRLLVIDHTAAGDGTASGELKSSLLAAWPDDCFLQVHTSRHQHALVVRGREPADDLNLEVEGALARIVEYAPEVVLFRASADNPALWRIAEALIVERSVPGVTWIMDDWMERLRVSDAVTFESFDMRLRKILGSSAHRLAISAAMAAVLKTRYGQNFQVLSNGVLAEDWPDRSGVRGRPEREGRTIIRYAGGLAPDMTLSAVLLLAKAVEAVSQDRDVVLQINTQPHWINQFGARFSGIRNVSIRWMDLDATGYRQWLSEADVNVLAYNFDEASARYIGTSVANKLPECLASGAAILAIGPSHLNTLAHCDGLNFIYRHSQDDPAALRYLLRYIHDDVDERERRSALGRLHAFHAFNLAESRARLYNLLVAAAGVSAGRLGSAVRSSNSNSRSPQHAKISIVIPNFNGGDLIETTIRSIVHQGYPNLELILADGGSTDNSLSIVEKYGRHFKAIISEPDDGQGDALNKGFSLATGDIMGWMNSDDILMPGSLFTLDRVFAGDTEVSWLTGRKTMLLEDGSVYLVDPARPWSRARFLAGDYRYVQQESTFWRRSLWERAGSYVDQSLKLAVDLELWVRFFRYAKLHSLDTTVGAFRLRDGQRSGAQRDAYENECLMVLKRELLLLEKEYRATRSDILPNEFHPSDRASVEKRFPGIVDDDPPIIQFTGRARAYEAVGKVARCPAGEPFAPYVKYDGLYGHRIRLPDVATMQVTGLRVLFAPAQGAPFGSAGRYTDSEPATVTILGPFMIVQSEARRVEVLLRTSAGWTSAAATLSRDTVAVDLSVVLRPGRMRVEVNGSVLCDKGVDGTPAFVCDEARLGYGFNQRFWSGALGQVELKLADHNGEQTWSPFGLKEWQARREVRRDPAGLDLAPPPSGPRVDFLQPLKNIHRGERCFIMGSGPSLNLMDLDLLEGESVISCNASFLLFDRVRWRPQYYTCVDARVLTDRGQEIGEMLRDEPSITALFPSVVHLHDGSGQVLDTRKLVGVRENTLFFNEVYNSDRNLPYSMFSLDINHHVVMPYTVTITMLQIAAYLGYKEIYLIGCDTSYRVIDSVRQEGETAEGGIGLLLTSTEDDDPNHFDPRYFGKDRKWHNPQVQNMIMHYGYAKQVLDEAGVEVFNATVGGNLEVFPRVEFATLFGERHPAELSTEMRRAPRTVTSFTASQPGWETKVHIVEADHEGAASAGRHDSSAVMVIAKSGDFGAALVPRYVVALGEANQLVGQLSSAHKVLTDSASAIAQSDGDRVVGLTEIFPLLGISDVSTASPTEIALLWAEALGFASAVVDVKDVAPIRPLKNRLAQRGFTVELA